MDWPVIRAHALVLLATGLGILGMGMAFSGAMHGNIQEASRGIPFLLLGLWWAGRELGRSMLASRTRRLMAARAREMDTAGTEQGTS